MIEALRTTKLVRICTTMYVIWLNLRSKLFAFMMKVFFINVIIVLY